MLETSFFILSIVFLLMVLFSIPLFFMGWRALKNLVMALEEFNKKLPGILQNAEAISVNLKSTADTINRETASLSLLGDKIRTFAVLCDDIEKILLTGVKIPLVETCKTARAVLKGAQVFLHTYAAKTKEPQGGKGQCLE